MTAPFPFKHYTTPEEIAAEWGVPPRTVKKAVRRIGCCFRLGKRTILSFEDVQVLEEALRCPTSSSGAGRPENLPLFVFGRRPANPRDYGNFDRKLAEDIAAQAEAAARRGHRLGPEEVITMARAFIEYREAGHSARFLLKLENHFAHMRARDLKPEMIRQAARRLYPDSKPATWNRHVVTPMQAVINHAAGLGLCQPIRVKKFSEDPKQKTPATRVWVASFAAEAAAAGLPHLAAICLFMFGTAARIGEACALTWGDVDLDRRQVTIRMGKPTPWTRTAHLPAELAAALANIPSNREPGARVFGYAGRGSVQQSWDRTCERAGIERLTPHCCRHGFATTMLQDGFDVKTVAELGGWRDAATVLRTYAHALADRTVTDALFDTNLAHARRRGNVTSCNGRRNHR